MHITSELLSRHDRPGPRYTSYPTAIEFDASLDRNAYADHLRRSAEADDDLSIYVHLPFCAERCLYCACHAIINPDGRAGAPYMAALRREIELVAEHASPEDARRRVTQLHFGGGTPTFYPPEALARLIQTLERHFDIVHRAERAIELDPRQTTPEHLEWLATYGFNRISVGVQDLDEQVQKAINRVQPLGLTRAVVKRARAFGVEGVNVDLIYGLPHQTAESFRRTVERVVTWLHPNRLAVYSFAYVPWLKGHQKKLDADAMPTGREKLELLAVASDVLTSAGYRHIGMDHFALPDDELCRARDEGRLSRNFMGYTTAQAPESIGLGLSAIGYVDDAWVQNIKHLKTYQDTIAAGQLPTLRGCRLSDDDRLRAWVIREMMCNLHIDKRQVEERFDVAFDDALADAGEHLERLERDGLVELEDDVIRATELGQLFVRNIAMAFDGYLGTRKANAARRARTPRRGPTRRKRSDGGQQIFSRTV